MRNVALTVRRPHFPPLAIPASAINDLNPLFRRPVKSVLFTLTKLALMLVAEELVLALVARLTSLLCLKLERLHDGELFLIEQDARAGTLEFVGFGHGPRLEKVLTRCVAARTNRQWSSLLPLGESFLGVQLEASDVVMRHGATLAHELLVGSFWNLVVQVRHFLNHEATIRAQ